MNDSTANAGDDTSTAAGTSPAPEAATPSSEANQPSGTAPAKRAPAKRAPAKKRPATNTATEKEATANEPVGSDREVGSSDSSDGESDATSASSANRRRRGSRGGQRRKKPASGTAAGSSDDTADRDPVDRSAEPDELPEPIREGRPSSVEAGERATVRKPQIGDTRPAPQSEPSTESEPTPSKGRTGSKRRRKGAGSADSGATNGGQGDRSKQRTKSRDGQRKKRRGGGGGGSNRGAELEAELLEQRRGRERKGKPIGRYFMAVQVRPGVAQVAVLEGRNLIEHYVSRPSDDISQIHGNIYVGKVQNVLPGMEAAFVDIATPKNAVLYRGDVQYEPEDIVERGKDPGSRTS